jgi:hypothetical protein
MAENTRDRIKDYIVRSFEKDGQDLSELQKAVLTSTTGSALIPYDLDPILHEELLLLQPLAELMNIAQADGKTHEYSARTAHPSAWFEGETTPQNPLASTYVRKTVALKIQRIWGSVTGFQQVVSRSFIDSLATELEGSLEGMANVMEYGALWGSADDIGFTGDAYQYSGIVPRVFAYAPTTNVIDGGGNAITLDDLDQMMAAAASFRGVRGDQKLWLMSTRMRQIVDGLQTKVQIPLTQAELADGKITMAAYDGVPILESNYVAPAATSTSPSDLAATKDDGAGALAADEWFYNISSVTLFGEQIAGTETSATTAGGASAMDLTWTADANAVAYIIWRGTVTGNANLQLLDIIAGKTYDAAGTVNGTVAAYTDTGARTPIAIKPLSTGEQNIIFVNLDGTRGVEYLGMIDDNGQPADRLFRYVPLAQVKDTYDYMLKGYLSLKLVHPNLAGVVRHVKLA